MSKEKNTNIIIYANTIDTEEYRNRLIEQNSKDTLEVNIVLETDEEITNLLWIERDLKDIKNKQINILLKNKYKLSKEALDRIKQIISIESIGEYKEYGENKMQLCCNIKPILEYKAIQRSDENLINKETINNFKNLIIRKKTSLQLSKKENGIISQLNSRKKTLEVTAKEFRYLTQDILEILEQRKEIELNFSDRQDPRQYFKCKDICKVKQLREKIEKYVEEIPKEANDIKKFLALYKQIANKVQYEPNSIEENYVDNFIKNIIQDKTIQGGYAYILKFALSILEIESRYVVGEIIGGSTIKDNAWNQVKLITEDGEQNWYNADISTDRQFIQNGKDLKYCLKTNKQIEKTHIAKTPIEECVKTISTKTINQGIGRYEDEREERQEYSPKITLWGKVKNIFKKLKHINRDKILTLPEPK